ncbi:hypothetical protein [Halobellus ordinarius]|uniref:hypothetical protein n=1 Tax=Halobellus ordinarius TaxID=3075120 RepID=UPI002880AB21|nr:hypothetical protein [Halobellus sp. ZY16]
MEALRYSTQFRWFGVFLAFLVITSGVATAQSAQPEWADEAFAEFGGMVATYNESITAVDLGVAGDQLANERVNLVVTGTDGETATFSFRMDGQLRMTELAQESRSDATLRMSTDRETFNETLTADNPAIVFRDAVAGGDIRFSGLGTGNAIKWTVINSAAGIARMLGLF